MSEIPDFKIIKLNDGTWAQAIVPVDADGNVISGGGGTPFVPANEVQTYYVGKHGSDSNNGKNMNNAFLTFGKALTEATAQTPSATNRFSVVCLDGGRYVSNITCVQYVDIYAPNATMVGALNLVDDNSIKFHRVERAGGNVVSKAGGSSITFVDIDQIVSTDIVTDASGLANFGAGSILIARVGSISVLKGFCIGSSSTGIGHMHIDIGDLYLSGDNVEGISITGGDSIVGRVDHIIEIGTQTDTIGINAVNGSVNINVSTIVADNAYTIETAGKLNLITNQITGTTIINGAGEQKVFNAQALSFSPDTDASILLGRLKISSPVTDTAYLSHFDRAGAADTNIKMTQNGELTLNSRAGSGREVNFTIGSVAKASIGTEGYLKNNGCFGEIYVSDNSTADTIATGVGYTKVTTFGSNGNAANVTADQANNKLTITELGIYEVQGNFNFSSDTVNTNVFGTVFLNAVEQDQIHFQRKIGTLNDVGSASMSGTIDITSVPVDLDFRARHDDAGGVDLIFTYMNLKINYIGKT